MSRLYEYADSNDKSGLFLLDGYKGNNTTFQVTTIAERLLLYFDYNPGTLHQERGPRIPDELHWGLFEIGWIYTNESGVTPPTSKAGEIIVEEDGVELTEQIADDLISFLKEADNMDEEIDELAEILNLDISNNREINELKPSDTERQTPICEVSEARFHDIEESIEMRLTWKLGTDGLYEWYITAELSKDEFSGVEKVMISIEVSDVSSNKGYLHIAYFCPKHGFERILTVANEEGNWENRLELEHHRQQIIDAIINEINLDDIDIGSPTSSLDLVTEFDPELLD